MESIEERISEIFETEEDSKPIKILRDAVHRRLKYQITQEELDDICVDVSYQYFLRDYSHKLLPTLPWRLLKYDSLLDKDKKQISAEDREALKKIRLACISERFKIRGINDSNLCWLQFISDFFRRSQMQDKQEKVDEVIAGFFE